MMMNLTYSVYAYIYLLHLTTTIYYTTYLLYYYY